MALERDHELFLLGPVPVIIADIHFFFWLLELCHLEIQLNVEPIHIHELYLKKTQVFDKNFN